MTLAKAELDEEAIAEVSREQLMKAWSEHVATGRGEPKLAAAKAQRYDADLERRRFEFEMMKFERKTAYRETVKAGSAREAAAKEEAR
jgi:hypothetical protein